MTRITLPYMDGVWTLPSGDKIQSAWWTVPLPECPRCGGDIVWHEAGYVPGYRRCMGVPTEPGHPSSISDARVQSIIAEEIKVAPHIHESVNHRPRASIQDAPNITTLGRVFSRLLAERNTCSDERVAEIDDILLYIISPRIPYTYDPHGGCGHDYLVEVVYGELVMREVDDE